MPVTGSPEPSARAGTPDSGPFPTGAVLQKLERPGLLSVSGLRGSAPAFSLAAAIARTQGPLLWIVPNRRSLEQRLGELRTFLGGSRPVLAYPDWEVEPYRGYSPDASKLHRQIAALTALAGEEPAVVVAEAAALLRRVLPLARLRERIESVEVACSLDRDALVRRLVERGYLVTEQCTEAGNLSVRGGVLDVFSPAHSLPLRIEFWGDEVESLRTFDPYTQRSVETLQSCRLAPVRELQLDTEATQLLPEQLKRLSDASGLSPRARKAIEEELLELRVLQEVELYLPLFEPRLDSVLTYLPDAGWVVVDGPEAIAAQLYGRRQTFTEAWEREGCADRLIPPPEALFLESPEFLEAVYDRRGVLLEDLGEAEDAEGALRISAPDHGDLRAEILAARSTSAKMLQPLLGRLEAWREAGAKVVLASPSLRQGDRLGALLEPHGLSLPRLPDGALAEAARTGSTAEFPSLSWSPGELRRGFCWIDRGLVVVAAEELLGRKSRSKASRRRAGLPPIGSLAQLRRDDCVVHNLHGIGRYLGLQRLDLGANALEVAADRKGRARDASYKPGTVAPLRVGGRSTAAVPDARGQDPVSGRTAPSSIPTAAAPANDYLVLEYKGGDRLFLPVHKLNLLSRYVSPGRAKPRLDKLGGTTWRKRR